MLCVSPSSYRKYEDAARTVPASRGRAARAVRVRRRGEEGLFSSSDKSTARRVVLRLQECAAMAQMRAAKPRRVEAELRSDGGDDESKTHRLPTLIIN